MKRIHLGFFVVSLLVLLQTAPALADVTSIIGGISCGNPDCQPTGAVPVLQGKRTVLLVDGQDVNFADKNNVDVTGSGVAARIIRDHLVSPKFGLGTGRAEVELNISDDAAPGERTVTLNHNGCIGCPRKYKFKILIVRDGRVTDVDVPSPSQFFQQVDITFSGERIGNAGVNLLGFPGGATAQVIESQSNESRAVVRLNFSNSRAEASGQIMLFEIGFHLRIRPVKERTNLQRAKVVVERHDIQSLTVGILHFSQSGQPNSRSKLSHAARERFELHDGAKRFQACFIIGAWHGTMDGIAMGSRYPGQKRFQVQLQQRLQLFGMAVGRGPIIAMVNP